MCRHWWEVRRTEAIWLRKFCVNGLGLLLTGTILIVTVTIKSGGRMGYFACYVLFYLALLLRALSL